MSLLPLFSCNISARLIYLERFQQRVFGGYRYSREVRVALVCYQQENWGAECAGPRRRIEGAVLFRLTQIIEKTVPG